MVGGVEQHANDVAGLKLAAVPPHATPMAGTPIAIEHPALFCDGGNRVRLECNQEYATGPGNEQKTATTRHVQTVARNSTTLQLLSLPDVQCVKQNTIQ